VPEEIYGNEAISVGILGNEMYGVAGKGLNIGVFVEKIDKILLPPLYQRSIVSMVHESLSEMLTKREIERCPGIFENMYMY
jgi:hypothetical protein